MPEGQEYSPEIEGLYPQEVENKSSFFQQIIENQAIFRERREGHEMPELSERIETEAKRIFYPYIDADFPRVLVSWNMLADLPEERLPYNRYEIGCNYPEAISEDDKRSYKRGIYTMNEWATNFATAYYLEHEKGSSIPKYFRSIYGRMLKYGASIGEHPIEGMVTNIYLDRVRKTAVAAKENFSDSIFQALFQHDFKKLNDLIAKTDGLQADNVDQLALKIGNKGDKVLDSVSTNSVPAHFLPSQGPDSTAENPTNIFNRTINKTAQTLKYAGYHAQPGIARILVPLHAVTGFVGAKYVAVHESLHAYSASPDFVGLMPKKLKQKS